MTCLRPIIPFGVKPMKAILVTVTPVSATIECAREPDATVGWPFAGSDQAHTKYSATGDELWRCPTPFPTNANPMTYRTESGRQYVVIATGRSTDAVLVAVALPGQ